MSVQNAKFIKNTKENLSISTYKSFKRKIKQNLAEFGLNTNWFCMSNSIYLKNKNILEGDNMSAKIHTTLRFDEGNYKEAKKS